MSEPSGAADLIADGEEWIKKQEQQIAAKKAELESMRGKPVVLDEDGNEVSPSTELAISEDGYRELPTNGHPFKWDTVTFEGETFNVRHPRPQALMAFALASGKYVKEETQRNMISKFLTDHLSPLSFDRFMGRMMDPDDEAFTAASMGELIRLISKQGTSRPTELSRA